LNDSGYKAAKEARVQERRQKMEADVTAKFSVQFNDEWKQKEAILKKKIAVEKAAMKKTMKKVQKVSKKIWNFITS